MNESRKSPAIANDGGGTLCRLALDDGKSAVAVETGSAHDATDFDGPLGDVIAGFDRSAKQAGLTLKSPLRTPAFAGLAGMIGKTVSERMRKAMPCAHIRIEDDRAAALRGAIAHCGTGSFLATRSQGTMRCVGS